MSNDWKKDLSLMMRNAVWNWSTEKYKAYVTLINDLYNYKIFKVGEFPIKPLKVGDEKTLPLAKKAVFKYIEDHSTGESMSKAREFLLEYSGYASPHSDIKGIEPGAKDIGRIKDILVKSNKDRERAMRLVTAMAKAITNIEKAQRRAKAAYEIFPIAWAREAGGIFLAKW